MVEHRFLPQMEALGELITNHSSFLDETPLLAPLKGVKPQKLLQLALQRNFLFGVRFERTRVPKRTPCGRAGPTPTLSPPGGKWTLRMRYFPQALSRLFYEAPLHARLLWTGAN